MNSRLPVRLWFVGAVAPPVVASTMRAILPNAAIYADPAVGHAMMALHCVAKAGCLLLAAVTAASNALGFERDNPVRRAWWLLSAGFSAFFLGQACYAPPQIVHGVEAAFPSIADAFWVAGYPFFVIALARFTRVYADAGLDVGSRRQRYGVVLATVGGCAAVGYSLLRPIALSRAPTLEKVINLSYSTLDLAILVAAAGLVRITMPLGGRVGRIWIWMLGGFVLACGGDVAFSYMSQLDLPRLKPLVDVMLLASYAALARATIQQRRLAFDTEA